MAKAREAERGGVGKRYTKSLWPTHLGANTSDPRRTESVVAAIRSCRSTRVRNKNLELR